MVIHFFPGPADALERHAHRGAADIHQWTEFLSHLRDRVPGSATEIVYLPRDREAPALRLVSCGVRVAPAREPDCDVAALAAGRTVLLARQNWKSVPLEGVGLVLARLASGSWLLRCWLPEKSGPAQHRGGVTSLLSRLAPKLIASFAVSMQLAHGARPAPGDLEAIWDRIPHCMLLVTPDLRVLAGNAAAEDMRLDRSLFRPGGGDQPLMAASPLLREEIDEAIHLVSEGVARHCSIRLPVGDGDGEVLRMHIADARFTRVPASYPVHPVGRPAQLVMGIGSPEDLSGTATRHQPRESVAPLLRLGA